jgi:hypothetical protein
MVTNVNKIIIILFSVLFLVCSCEAVEPWERGYLAKPEMTVDVSSLETTLNSHIFFSKEASSGGHGAAGGGCGCN